MTHVRALFALLLTGLVLAAPATVQAAVPEPVPTKWGYLTLPDGTQLKWSVILPPGKGPFPTLMQYEGYQAGSDPSRAANPKFISDMLAKGYAIYGVSARGSACSSGTWDLFGKQQGDDGAYALDWGAKQPWSNGKVALFSYSYAGIMQMWVAESRPRHLVALAPGNVVADTYRDISYPGGVPNVVFPPEWGVALQADWGLAAEQATREGDATCLANVGTHDDPTKTLAYQQLQHPTDDQWHHDHSLVDNAQNIDVPLLGVRTWQDEETGSRQAHYWDKLDPKRTWLLASNGNHLLYQFSDAFLPTLEGFFDHFLKGEDNGFEKTPHLQVWHETDPFKSAPRSVTTQQTLPVRLDEAKLYLGPDGTMDNSPGTDGASDYDYPVPSPPVVDTSSQGLQPEDRDNTWTHTPYLAAGRVVFTTPPLTNTVTTYGPASADLWISTGAPDVDLQVTVTEVRPDGQETYVQRGWLRASHRALDPARSTDFDPYTLDTQDALKDMPADLPQLLRVPVFPFGHTFRPGSSLRIYVEQPSVTGLWGYQTISTPQTLSIHYGKRYPSRLVLGLLPDANVKPTLPGCDQLLAQACRDNPVPQPAGRLTVDVVSGSAASRTAATHAASASGSGRRLRVSFLGRRAAWHGAVLVWLRAYGGRYRNVTVRLRSGKTIVAQWRGSAVGKRTRTAVLRRRRRLAAGRYTLEVRTGGKLVVRRVVRLRNVGHGGVA